MPITKIDQIQNSVNYAEVGNIINLQSGTYTQRVVIDKGLTLQGLDSATCILDGTGLGSGSGIAINGGVTNVSIKEMRIQNFTGTSGNSTAAIFATSSNNDLTIHRVTVQNNPSNHGIFGGALSGINNVSITNSRVINHGPGLRGIVLWDGLKTNITISNNLVSNNACCGIELQDGDASGVTVSGNTVDIGGGDNAIGLTGLNFSVGANLVSNNIITGGGRFGIEIKNPSGGVTVSGNNVKLTTLNTDQRDRAGIAVFRRSVLYNNVDIPNGVTVSGNTVEDYRQTIGNGEEGFGIVIEGTNHTVTGNTVNNCDVAIQQQGGLHPFSNYPGDGSTGSGSMPVLSPNYFGRGNSPYSCGNVIDNTNIFNANTVNVRNVISSSNYGLVTNTNNGETFCNIQAAIDDAQTINGHTLTLAAGNYNETVVINKELTITGAGKGSNPATNTVLTAPSSCVGVGFTISAPNVTVQNMYVTNFQDAVLLNGVVNPTINNMALIDYCRYGVSFGGNNSSIDILLTDIQRTSLLAGTVGMRVGTANAVNGLFMDGCTITGNALQGIVVFQATTPVAFDDITIQNSTISNNLQKGMYFEKLSNATFEGLTMADNGTDASYNFNNGIDINLKHNAYSNITIQDCDITNSGHTGTAPDPQNPSAITIKARDDASSYNTIPASLSNVTIKNNRITGPRNGIRIGEIGKVNATPTNLLIEGNDLSFAFDHKAIISRITSDINVVCNWHGTTDLGTILNTFVEGATGDILLGTVLSSGVDGNVAPGFQPAGSCQCANSNLVTNTNTSETFCDLQSAIDDAQTLDGHTLTVSAGTYVENVIVSKELSILGPNSAIDPCSMTPRVAEAIVVPAAAAISSGEIFHVAASNVTISGLKIDGDNTAITSGFSSTNGADIDAAEGITVYETAINNLTASNNIIQNLSYFGLTLYDYPAGVPSTGHTISNNKIQNLGTYDVGSGIQFWGGGVLLYNNQYALVSNNCMTNVRMGVQTGNFSAANPGSSTYAQIDNNTIAARRRGVFHNLHYSTASPYTFSNNTITGVEHASETFWDGILLASLSVNSTSSGNTINGSAVTKPSEGYEVWNVKNTSPALISGGSVSNVDIGVFVNNYDGYASDAGDGAHVTINGLSIIPEATGTGIRLFDNPLATSNSNVQATLGAGVVITGGTDGLVIENSTAMVASPLGNVAFSGQSANYIELINNLNNIDATAASFGGVTGGTGTKTQLYDIEDKILHSVDISTLGFVTVKASNAYVTPNSFDSPTTTTPSVQRAIAAVANPGTVNIEAGNYSPNTMDATGKNITFSPGSSPACIMVGDFTLNPSDVLDMEINSTTPCTGHDQIQVTGTVTLGGATLTVTLGYAPTIGDQITIIDNDDVDAVSGQFAQGTSITVGLYTFRIDYAGGTGNDVVLTYCKPTIVTCAVTQNIDGCNTNAITGPIYSETSANSSEAEFEDMVNMGNITDPCSIASVTYIDTKAGTCPIVVTRIWTVTDVAGGTATCTQTINVDDNTPPNFTSCPTTITLNNVPTFMWKIRDLSSTYSYRQLYRYVDHT
ncbi:MAG: right-handed parallel beta-helix repeat-containing protein [Saprospiraceae bacterium]|nr:right-handed parallel beta-helix repeat-containing protein [Saprospiraceae bacterium]